ncbi:MAG: hypothetical protein EA402_09400 [Planctomycetota bacterium]|nr:MAG: hypothetical protein EA402_09400 [Planctomycetota bacterium]
MGGLVFLDWLVLVTYLLMVGLVAWRAGRRHRSRDTLSSDEQDYVLAGRSIPAWAAAVSFMATALSAATFIGASSAKSVGGFWLRQSPKCMK